MTSSSSWAGTDEPLRSRFRRANIAIEVLRSRFSPADLTGQLLQEPNADRNRLHTTRKQAESLEPNLPPLSRRRISRGDRCRAPPAIQEEFQRPDPSDGGDDCLWHGIDKADVRTVIHTALPAAGSVLPGNGRAGRDGAPSRAI